MEDVERIDTGSCYTLKAGTKVNILLLKLFEATVFFTAVLHKDLITNLHEASTVRCRMTLAIFFDVLLIFAKIIEDLRIWTTRIADWRRLNTTTTRPPVFLVVIEEDALARLNAALVAILCSANLSNLRFDASLSKNFLPNSSSLIVAWNTVLFRTNEAGDIDFAWVETDLFRQEGKEVSNLLLFKIITQRPVAKHFKYSRMTRVANIINILQAKTWLRVSQTGAILVFFTQKIRHERLHARASEKRGRIVLKHQGGRSNLHMTLRFHKLEIFLSYFTCFHAEYFNIFLQIWRASNFCAFVC